ncbi:MAG: elongation factor G, partial [Pirellulaceae bacterium]
MARDLKHLRNIGIIAHIDAGKTTVTERMLYYSGAIHKMGGVDEGTTTTDFDPEEQERGITIYSACVTFNWKHAGTESVINLIDTPGHVDFTAEVERSLRVLDGAVVVFSAREGVEAQSETVWRQADKYRVPRLAFINKMDREGASYTNTFNEIRKRLGANPVAIQMPVGCGPSYVAEPFRGVIDLVRMKMIAFDAATQGKTIVETEIPAELRDEAELERAQLIEQLYDYSDELMECSLAEKPVTEELLRRVIRQAVIHNQVQPVLCGSALHYMGVQPILDAVVDYLPCPLDVPPVEGTNPKKKDKVETRKPSVDDPFCGLVFKIEAGRHGDLYFVRVYSGELKANSRAYNPGKDKKENVSQLWHIQADRREFQVDRVEAGDIVGIIGPRTSVTGDTLCDAQDPILLESITFPETVISMAIEPESSADRKKLADVLEMMRRQDPTFRTLFSDDTGQTLISGMGELHLEVITHRLERDFNLKVRVHRPRVSYRETIERSVEVNGQCQRQQGGQSLFAGVRIRMEPFDKSDAVVVLNQVQDEVPPEFVEAAVQTLKDLAAGGGWFGNPLMKARITLLSCKMHETDSNELAFTLAANDAFQKGLQEAGTVVLEPIMQLEITTPEDYFGEFVSDLQQRRGIITQTTQRGHGTTVISAEAPLANLFGYSGAMRSLSQGRASCTMAPSKYAPAPPEGME